MSATSGPFALPRWPRHRDRAAARRTASAGSAARTRSAVAAAPAPSTRAALGDGLSGEPLFHLLVHVRRYRALYALAAAWIVALAVIQPLDRAGGRARAPRLAAAAPLAAPPAAPAAPTPAAPADAAAAVPDSGAALSTPDPAAPSTDQAAAAPSYTAPDTPPPPDSPPSQPAPPPPPPQAPNCSADSNLPAPVASTAVGGLQKAQASVASATGQPPPVDAAGTVGTAAGCSPGGSGGSTPTAAGAGAAPRPSAASPTWAWLGPLTIW